MIIMGIDRKLCINCGKCVEDCPEDLFQAISPNTTVFNDRFHRCILCGHCLSVCPVNAVLFEDGEKPLEHPLISQPEKILGSEDLLLLLRARRSIRRFSDQAVPGQTLGTILDAMRYAPTGSNRQDIHYSVLVSREEIMYFSRQVIGLFKQVRVLLAVLRCLVPFGRKKKGGILRTGMYMSLKNALKKAKAGQDPIFYHAHCVIVVSATPYAHQSGVDAGIILTHGMLAAQSLGLGTCLVGFAHEKLLVSSGLRRRLRIPRGYKPQGVMALGYPAVRYLRAPMRKPVVKTVI
jgi:nitroreductase/NAD-dependent dihydropyrimidine dehydrogenase PreA subunit